MKNLLKNFAGVLGGLFFAAAAAYGISGGPVYNPPKPNLNGSFAGVMLPKASPSPTATNPNALGIFSFFVAQPTAASTGNANGHFLLFTEGRVFSGTVTGTADATTAKINAILQGSATPPPMLDNITGTMNAHAKTVTDTRFESSGVQLRGTATMFETATSRRFKVRGFQHASPAPTATP